MNIIDKKIKLRNMIIVTGGSSGIGRFITDSLRLKGEKVTTISRTKIIEDENHFSCDISDFNSLKNIYKELNRRQESITALINCAGIASMNLALTTPSGITENILKTNLMGTIFCNQIFSPLLIKNKGGRIINFSTIAVSIGLKGESIYVASKAGVEAFSRVFAKELANFNITVNCIAPGPIKTNLLKGISDKQIKDIIGQQIIQKEMKSIDIFRIVELLLGEDSANITGQVLHVGGV
jgi:3-oxoacyl-[acyl-carrier protein] reductase